MSQHAAEVAPPANAPPAALLLGAHVAVVAAAVWVAPGLPTAFSPAAWLPILTGVTRPYARVLAAAAIPLNRWEGEMYDPELEAEFAALADEAAEWAELTLPAAAEVWPEP